jgi:ATP-dependent Lon protease
MSGDNKDPVIITSNIIDDENENFEFIPISGDDLSNSNIIVPDVLPILPLRNTVLFPGVIIPITVGRDKSIKLIKDHHKTTKIVGVVSQKDGSIEEPTVDDLNNVGTVAVILKMFRLPDGNTTVIIQGKKRFRINEVVNTEPYITAKVVELKENKIDKKDREISALLDSIKEIANKFIQLSPNIPSEAVGALRNINDPIFLVHFISSNLGVSLQEKQAILEIADFKERAEKVLSYVTKDLQLLEMKTEIQNKARQEIDKQQREYFIQQQIKAFQEELGHESPDKEIANMKERGAKKQWAEYVAKHFQKEMEKIQRINPMSPEFGTQMNYLQLLLDLPWSEKSKDNFDLKHAKKILDEDHYGLDKIKDRILEYLAVLKLKGNMKSPILCLYGPPGVGKTSLGKSIARAIGRKYVRMSIGGLHDEAEIRGHRKTYIGAMPGRIIQNIKKGGTNNPVMVLDEIDKVGRDNRGDPSSALLEVLDPEQNATFYDNYIELDYDLSNVLFIATANSLDTIQPALLDRLEIIEINGYTQEEKVQIAKKYLVPKQRTDHGLKVKDFTINDKVLEIIINDYTRESGVRGLEKRIAALARAFAMRIVMDKKANRSVSEDDVVKVLGAKKVEHDSYQNNEVAGVVTGLAYTQVGGEILFIESRLTRGTGKLTLTGQLGDVMKESAVTALTYLKSQADTLKIDHRLFDKYDIHIHVPAGAVPKDGPSAGVTMLTSLASVFTQRKVKAKLAMTGEITLRGKVLPIGGVKEKILAAKRAGITDIILCQANKKDIDEISASYLKGLNFHFVENMMDVIKVALLKDKVTNAMEFKLEEVKTK